MTQDLPLYIIERWNIPYFICIETPERQMPCYQSHKFLASDFGYDYDDFDGRDHSTLKEPECQSCGLRKYRQQLCVNENGYYTAWKGILVTEVEPKDS